MDDRTPHTPEETTPDPHRGEPAPPPEEGLRPEADPEVVRPAASEPNGPVSGLMHASATQVAAEVGRSPKATAEAARLGVEGEGVESMQIMTLLVATILTIACILLFLYFLYYLPQLNANRDEASDVSGAARVELRENRSEAFARISQYAAVPDAEGRYLIPIEAAMARVASSDSLRAPAPGGPVSRADFNLSWITLHPAPAVASAGFAAPADSVGSEGAPSTAPSPAEPAEPPSNEPPSDEGA